MNLVLWLGLAVLLAAGAVYLFVFRKLKHIEVHDGQQDTEWTVDGDAFYHKVWRSTYAIFGADPPTRFSICPYFWRIVLWSWLIFWPLGALFYLAWAAGWVVKQPFRPVRWLWKLACSRRRGSFTKDVQQPDVRPFKYRHPTVTKIGNGLGYTLIAIGVMVVLAVCITAIVQKSLLLLVIVCIVLIYAVAIGSVLCIRLALDSDTAHVFGAFLKAKRSKLCPYVTVKQ